MIATQGLKMFESRSSAVVVVDQDDCPVQGEVGEDVTRGRVRVL